MYSSKIAPSAAAALKLARAYATRNSWLKDATGEQQREAHDRIIANDLTLEGRVKETVQ
jgi:hypothetical protein